MASSLQSDQGSPQPAQVSPASRRWSLPEYELAVMGLALLAALALAWLYVVRWAPGMAGMAGTMGLGAWAFVGMWAVMVIAMMFPTVTPTGFRLAGRNAPGAGRPTDSAGMLRKLERTTSFVLGYYAVWVVFGLAIYAVFAGAAGIVHLSASDDKWIAAAVYAVAAIYQFTPAKRACLGRCVSPQGAVGTTTGRSSRLSVIRESAQHALSCIGCCWAFMAVLIAVGLMNIAAMVILTVAIFVERHVKQWRLVSYTVGVLLVAAAVLTPFFGWLHPGLPGSTVMPMHMPTHM